MASSTTMNSAVITAATPRELLTGTITPAIIRLFMTHHHLYWNNEWIGNSDKNGNDRHKKIVIVGPTDSERIGVGEPRAGGCEIDVGRVHSGPCQIVIYDRKDFSPSSFWRTLDNSGSCSFARSISHNFPTVHHHA